MPIAFEGLGVGRKLADALGQELSAIIFGSGAGSLGQQAIAHGADKVYVINEAQLNEYQPDLYLLALENAVNQVKPQVIIMGQTDNGRELAARLAFRLHTEATLDCVDLGIDAETKRLLQTKPVYGGNAQAVIVTETDPQVVTIRTKAFSALAPDASRKGETIALQPMDLSAVKTRITNRVVEDVAGIKIDKENPGYKHFYLAPHPGGGLTHAGAEHQTMYGIIKSGWKIEGDNFMYEVEIPANTTATVILPGKEKEPQKLGSGKYSFSFSATGF